MHELPPIPNCEVCLGCGADNPHGLRLRFTVEDGEIASEVLPDEHFQGFRGYLHGAAIAAIMDEVQARATWALGIATVTAELNVRYLAPVPIGQPLRATARLLENKEDRVFRTSGELRLPDGQLAASATAVFAVPRGGTFMSQAEAAL
ncbi:MAG TPA: PaaI family thioesterase [Chloroflexota bacterium]|nr:PaaI family thioesterase [Chloroflexota bacterium]